ncbi:MAG: T9SS type A sorting domain-containing protein, partial [Lentimicrobiaceae bacterium]|nr:T9SS type A sorting domain-containing protein [Lentimicrobiaceae bacterium]
GTSGIYAGGLIAYGGAFNTVSNCYSTGAVNGSSINSAYAGGIVGNAATDMTILNCAALNPSITCTGSTTDFGRVVGNVNGTLNNNIAFDKMINPSGGTTWDSSDINGTDFTIEEINEDGTLGDRFTAPNGWTTANGFLPGLFGNTVNMPAHLKIPGDDEFAGGDGSEENPYQIANAKQLALLATLVNNGDVAYNATNKYYILINNIDLSDYQEGEGWTPIGINAGSISSRFRSNFDGNGKIITGLKIDNTTLVSVGLFGFIYSGTVKNLGIEDADIRCSPQSTNFEAGGIAGWLSSYGSISNCYTTGMINASAMTPGLNLLSYAGGIVGDCYTSCTVSNCYSMMAVTATVPTMAYLACAGGVVGYVSQNCTISNCYSAGTVDAYREGKYNIGGVVGSLGSGSKIEGCAALNSGITCTSEDFGRVLGANSGGTLESNIAFDKMLNPLGETTWDSSDFNGIDFTVEEINEDGTLGERFTASNGWTTANGFLPGLFGNLVEMPPHLQLGVSTYTITATAGENGTINPAGTITVPAGENSTFTFTADSNYKIDQVLIDGANNPAAVTAGSYTFENIMEDHTIHVTFLYEDGIELFTNYDLQIYPNPTSGELRIESVDIRVESVDIFDIYGRKLYLSTCPLVHLSTATIDISHLQSGIYFMKVITDQGIVMKKIVKN